jgi:hypothetical protein
MFVNNCTGLETVIIAIFEQRKTCVKLFIKTDIPAICLHFPCDVL